MEYCSAVEQYTLFDLNYTCSGMEEGGVGVWEGESDSSEVISDEEENED